MASELQRLEIDFIRETKREQYSLLLVTTNLLLFRVSIIYYYYG